MGRSSVTLLVIALVAGCKSQPQRIPHHQQKFTQQPGLPFFAGMPQPASKYVVLENLGYVVGYSEARRNPLWASYRLFPVDDPESHPRPSHFNIDERTTARVKHDCYTNQGFDRGHNAPNSAIDSRYGQVAQKQTFLMSNVMPQTCNLNREPWQAFEKLVEKYAEETSELHVISGPIFSDDPSKISCDVEVPIAFYKIVIENETAPIPRALAVLMVQEDAGTTHALSDFITTIDCIEKLTALDFHPELPDELETLIEAERADEDWRLDTILAPTANCPGQHDVALGADKRKSLLEACEIP